MNYAAIIKEQVSTPELFSFYGFKRNGAGFVRCPFHNEKTASMKVYDGSRGYHCFGGCGAHGDIINFVQSLFGLSFQEAMKKVNDDFRLGLPIDDSMLSKVEKHKADIMALERQKQKEAERKEHEKLYNAYSCALDEWARLDTQRIRYAPKTQNEPFHALYTDALRNIDLATYYLDINEDLLYQFEKKIKLSRR